MKELESYCGTVDDTIYAYVWKITIHVVAFSANQ